MTGLKLTPYDSADYLDSEAGIAAYIDAARVEGDDDPPYMAHIRRVATKARAKIEVTLTANETRPEFPND